MNYGRKYNPPQRVNQIYSFVFMYTIMVCTYLYMFEGTCTLYSVMKVIFLICGSKLSSAENAVAGCSTKLIEWFFKLFAHG